jgi:protein SCO1
MILLVRLLAVASALLLGSCSRGWVAPDFRLTDDDGAPWTLADQRAKTVVLTFGFTHCADTCPATLSKLTHLVDALGDRSRSVEVVFVTVDPQRDTPHALHHFLARFSGGFAQVIGLTGAPPQIDSVERAYHVWAQRIPGRNPSSYDVAHSAVIYFIGPGGRIRALHDDDDPDAVLSAALREAAS